MTMFSYALAFGHFFSAGYGSIYPALGSLAEAGLVTFTEIAQDGRPDRKVYRITDKGRDALMQALDNPAPAHKLRSEFLAMLFFAHLMTEEQINTVLDSRVGAMNALLETLDDIDTDEIADWTAGTRFVAGFGRAMATAGKRYIEEHRELLTEDPADHSANIKSALG